jgi:hypothetical protein
MVIEAGSESGQNCLDPHSWYGYSTDNDFADGYHYQKNIFNFYFLNEVILEASIKYIKKIEKFYYNLLYHFILVLLS